MIHLPRSSILSLGAVLILSTVPSCSSADARSSVDAQSAQLPGQVQTYELSGERVAIYNLAGSARVEASDGSAVVVEITRLGNDAGRLDVQVDELGGRQSLRVLYPEDRISYPESPRNGRSQIRVKGDGTFGEGGRGLLGRRVTISNSGGGLEAWSDVRVLVPEGRDVRLYVGVGDITADGVRGDLRLDVARGSVQTSNTTGPLVVDSGSGDVDVREVDGTVSLDTGSGSVRLAGVRGDADVDTGSGTVDVTGIEGDHLVVDTGSGSVRGGDLMVDLLDVDTGSGGVRLDNVSSLNVRVDTGSGSVALGLRSDVDRLDIDTGSGGVDLTIPQEFGADISIDTGSGGISADVPIQIRSSRRGRLQGTIGDGIGEVDIETGRGGVRIAPS